MINNKTLNGLKIKYDYPPVPPKGINMNREYEVKEGKDKFILVSGEDKVELTEDEIRVYFILSK